MPVEKCSEPARRFSGMEAVMPMQCQSLSFVFIYACLLLLPVVLLSAFSCLYCCPSMFTAPSCYAMFVAVTQAASGSQACYRIVCLSEKGLLPVCLYTHAKVL